MTVTAEKPKAARNPWGNPKASAFRKATIRQINYEGATAEVHKDILDIAVQLLHMAHEQGVLTEGPVASYDPKAELDQPQAYGCSLAIEGEIEGASEWGFKRIHGYGYVFVGDPQAAEALSGVAQELHAARGNHEDIIPEEEQAWAHTRPGTRVIERGARGDDVQFVQQLLGASDHGGIFDEATEAAVRWLQEQKGIPVTGIVDNATWTLMFPRTSAFGLGRGATGFSVRVAQALLVAYGHEPELPITSRYGVETDKAIRRLQEERGFRVNGYMRNPEWVALLGPRDSWPTRDFVN